jgi:hypothetical protein
MVRCSGTGAGMSPASWAQSKGAAFDAPQPIAERLEARGSRAAVWRGWRYYISDFLMDLYLYF